MTPSQLDDHSLDHGISLLSEGPKVISEFSERGDR